jgi:hypothetical protein
MVTIYAMKDRKESQAERASLLAPTETETVGPVQMCVHCNKPVDEKVEPSWPAIMKATEKSDIFDNLSPSNKEYFLFIHKRLVLNMIIQGKVAHKKCWLELMRNKLAYYLRKKLS